ncbi:hypothetical protein MRX96_023440 [Rhipicephalus microplus]
MQRPTRAHSADLALHFGHHGSGRARHSVMLIASSCKKRRSNNVSDVRPSSCCLRENTAYRVTSRFSLCLLVYYLFQNLQHYLSILGDGQEHHDTSSRSRAFKGFFVLEEFGMSSGTSFFILELQLILEESESLIAGKHLSLWAGFQLGLEPGARPGAHLPRDLIDVLRSTLATLNTLHIVSVCSITSASVGVFLKLQCVCKPAAACTSIQRTLPAFLRCLHISFN